MAETLKSVEQIHDEHGPTDSTATFGQLWHGNSPDASSAAAGATPDQTTDVPIDQECL